MLTVGSLFSGIGGFDLGLERAGMRVIWQSEIDPYASAVLRKHWPHVPNLGDIRNITAAAERPDVLCGGFPCQPFSTAARGRNNAVDLWPEMRRVVGAIQPRFVIAENVPGIGDAGIERVCVDLEALDYAVRPMRVDVAPPGRHRGRIRLIFVAHANSEGEPRCAIDAEMARISSLPGCCWENDSMPLGMDDELPSRMDRLRCLGNAFPPAAAEVIGRAIVNA